jgi:acyl-CoA reductase-like NAD-dependent aldehyde dehydrogenase
MSPSVKLISPVDGSVYAERPYATDAALDAAIAKARVAQA